MTEEEARELALVAIRRAADRLPPRYPKGDPRNIARIIMWPRLVADEANKITAALRKGENGRPHKPG